MLSRLTLCIPNLLGFPFWGQVSSARVRANIYDANDNVIADYKGYSNKEYWVHSIVHILDQMQNH
ncbi:MAG: hypothetical protein ACRCR9_05655 [Chitinophagaceae bacterium]